MSNFKENSLSERLKIYDAIRTAFIAYSRNAPAVINLNGGTHTLMRCDGICNVLYFILKDVYGYSDIHISGILDDLESTFPEIAMFNPNRGETFWWDQNNPNFRVLIMEAILIRHGVRRLNQFNSKYFAHRLALHLMVYDTYVDKTITVGYKRLGVSLSQGICTVMNYYLRSIFNVPSVALDNLSQEALVALFPELREGYNKREGPYWFPQGKIAPRINYLGNIFRTINIANAKILDIGLMGEKAISGSSTEVNLVNEYKKSDKSKSVTMKKIISDNETPCISTHKLMGTEIVAYKCKSGHNPSDSVAIMSSFKGEFGFVNLNSPFGGKTYVSTSFNQSLELAMKSRNVYVFENQQELLKAIIDGKLD